ncbi:VOC family protein [Fodinibius salsisoli]|uniref:VOC family protein n=1 Tax=Fodinibius salsisoli TaxID=2820877 RepID=A0ABT3PRF9_9BACT|nr:VOC family protein [Fodinibius salsisoli]MCW9708448.1 VOC family protein [Fodinibius salsisoli]
METTVKERKNAVAWFEIPVKKLKRAKKFYQRILDIEMADMDMGDELKMSMFPTAEMGVSGALCEHKEFYKPSKKGALIYLNANPDLQSALDEVKDAGGEIFQPKTKITDEYGFMAIIEDTEGNRVALHSEH